MENLNLFGFSIGAGDLALAVVAVVTFIAAFKLKQIFTDLENDK